jgi:putative spermidine/putrescine transport system permease protein
MLEEKPKNIYKQSKKSWVDICLYLFCALILFFLIFPLFIVIPISFSASKYLEFPPSGFSLQWYKTFFGTREWIVGFINSVIVGIMASFLASLIGVPAALVLGRKKFSGSQFIQSMLLSPMIVPVIIIAIALYFYFAKLHLIGNIYIIALAHSLLGIPFVLVTVSASLQGFDQTLEYASMSLGANNIQTFFKVTFPLIRPGAISGALFAFFISFDEVVIAVFLSTYRSLTLPKHMWGIIREEIDPTIAAVSTLLILISVAFLVAITILIRREERLKS